MLASTVILKKLPSVNPLYYRSELLATIFKLQEVFYMYKMNQSEIKPDELLRQLKGVVERNKNNIQYLQSVLTKAAVVEKVMFERGDL